MWERLHVHSESLTQSWRVVKLPKGASAQWETNSIPRCPLIKSNDDFKCTVSALKADGQRRIKLWLEGCGVSVCNAVFTAMSRFALTAHLHPATSGSQSVPAGQIDCQSCPSRRTQSQ